MAAIDKHVARIGDPQDPVPMVNRRESIYREVLIGAAVLGSMAALFAVAVVSFADCAGDHCARERVIGVAGHALGGMVLGALIGGGVAVLRRLLRRS
jgi:hypothetical protein